MPRKYPGFVRKAEEFLGNALKKLFGIALLKIGPSTSPDEEGVSGKEHTIDLECGAGIGVSWGLNCMDAVLADFQLIPVLQKQIRAGNPGGLTHRGFRTGHLTKEPGCSNMVGIDMGIHDIFQLNPQFFQKLEVPLELFF